MLSWHIARPVSVIRICPISSRGTSVEKRPESKLCTTSEKLMSLQSSTRAIEESYQNLASLLGTNYSEYSPEQYRTPGSSPLQ